MKKIGRLKANILVDGDIEAASVLGHESWQLCQSGARALCCHDVGWRQDAAQTRRAMHPLRVGRRASLVALCRSARGTRLLRRLWLLAHGEAAASVAWL